MKHSQVQSILELITIEWYGEELETKHKERKRKRELKIVRREGSQTESDSAVMLLSDCFKDGFRISLLTSLPPKEVLIHTQRCKLKRYTETDRAKGTFIVSSNVDKSELVTSCNLYLQIRHI